MKARLFLLSLLSCVLVLPAAQQVITPGAGITAAAGRDMINANFTELYARADIRSNGRNIYTSPQFQAALLEAGPITLHLRADITLTAIYTVGTDKVIVPDNYRFIQGGAGGLICLGLLDNGRDPVFSGFAAGDIRGTFGRESIYPEWWGLEDGRHDLAINAAVRASPVDLVNVGVTVSLAAGRYSVARPIDTAGRSVTIQGAGSGKTNLYLTSAWTADPWVQSEIWGDPVPDVTNHAAAIWIGGETNNPKTYWTQVIGIHIECYEASFAHRATKRVSGISAKGGLEEGSVIHDVTVSYASGFGIGFCRNKHTDGSYYASVVNGLRLTNLWITEATFADSVPLHLGQWVNNCHADVVTVDVGLDKSNSLLWNTGGAPGGADTTVYTTAPVWVRDYPNAAIVAGGNLTLSNIHIEGATIGVRITQNSSANNVVCTNIKAHAMMDRARGAVYELDGFSNAAPPANTDFHGYGCVVLIAGTGMGSENKKDCVTLTAITSLGGCVYLVRDDIYGVERTIFGMGQFPAGDLYGRFAFYSRGNAYVGPVSDGVTVYNKAAPSTDRTYFTGPIY